MTNVIAAAIAILILGAAIAYIVREKRRGVKCVGCPDADVCARRAQMEGGGGCGCGCHGEPR